MVAISTSLVIHVIMGGTFLFVFALIRKKYKLEKALAVNSGLAIEVRDAVVP